jgi:hypothetical protein
MKPRGVRRAERLPDSSSESQNQRASIGGWKKLAVLCVAFIEDDRLIAKALISACITVSRRRTGPSTVQRLVAVNNKKPHRADTSNSTVFDSAVPFQKFINAMPGVSKLT